MIGQNNVLAIIPARGGSKGLPGKNIKSLSGKPLIGWTIEQAKNSIFLDEVFVSTDSIEIANIASLFGVQVPFLRPEFLASNSASSTDVVLHVLEHFKSINRSFQYIALLEPTSPLRKPNDIDDAIKLLYDNSSADGVVSLGEVHMEHPMIIKKINKEGKIIPYDENLKPIKQRQQADIAYFPYGVIYLIKTEVLYKINSFYSDNIIPFYIERWQNYEIDDLYDFLCIEAIFKSKLNVLA